MHGDGCVCEFDRLLRDRVGVRGVTYRAGSAVRDLDGSGVCEVGMRETVGGLVM